MSATSVLADASAIVGQPQRLRVVPLDHFEPGLRDSIDRLDARSPLAHPFQTEAFCTLMHTDPARSPYVIVSEDARGLAAYWRGYFIRYAGGLRHGTAAWVRSGPVVRADLAGRANDLLSEMLPVLKAHVKAQRVGWIIVTSETLYSSRMEDACRAAGFDRRDLATFVVDLRPPLEELWQRLDPRLRRSVSKAERSGVTIGEPESDDDIRAYHRMEVERASAPGEIPPSDDHFVRECRGLMAESRGRLLLAKFEDQTVAGSLILYHRGLAAQHQHAIYKEGRSLRAGDLLVWQSLARMKELGCTAYDFVTVEVAPEPGTREAGVREFKAKWGGSLVETPSYVYRSPMKRLWLKLRQLGR